MIDAIEDKLDDLREIATKPAFGVIDIRTVTTLVYEILQHLKKNGSVDRRGTLIDNKNE